MFPQSICACRGQRPDSLCEFSLLLHASWRSDSGARPGSKCFCLLSHLPGPVCFSPWFKALKIGVEVGDGSEHSGFRSPWISSHWRWIQTLTLARTAVVTKGELILALNLTSSQGREGVSAAGAPVLPCLTQGSACLLIPTDLDFVIFKIQSCCLGLGSSPGHLHTLPCCCPPPGPSMFESPYSAHLLTGSLALHFTSDIF